MNQLTLLLFSLFSLGVFAQDDMVIDQKTGKISHDKIGNVKFVKGKVFRTKNKEKSSDEIGVNFPILEKDIIQTEEKSIIKIIMNDSTIITLGENSHFNFKNYEMKSKSERVASYDLKSGNARIDVPVKITNGQLNFNTRTVSLGVRGTKFLMSQEIDSNGDYKEQIALLEGEVEIEFPNGTKKLLKEGDHLHLKKQIHNEMIFDKIVKMDKKFHEYLTADQIMDDSVKPFLAKMDDTILNADDTIQSNQMDLQNSGNSQNNSDSSSNSNGSSNLKKVKNFWQDSLRKLNEKLNKNNE